jgi:hypothetical protein
MHSSAISIWFFIGVLLTVYGAMIFGYGLLELATHQTANVVLANLHAPVCCWLWVSFMACAFVPDATAKPNL